MWWLRLLGVDSVVALSVLKVDVYNHDVSP